MAAFLRALGGEDGATIVEYAILASLIAAVCIAIVALVGANTANLFNSVNANL